MTGLVNLHAACAVTPSGCHDVPREFARPLRRADELTRMAVTAVCGCMAQLEHNGLPADLSRCAVVTGLGMGTLETNLAFVDSLYENDGGAGSPTLFSHSVHNTVAGYISRLFDVTGPAFTITDFAWPFITALSEARCCMDGGLADMAIVVGSEVESRFMRAVHARFSTGQSEAHLRWQTGAVAWIVARPDVIARPAALLHGPELNLCACSPEELLLRLTERYPGKSVSDTGVPFGYALSLNDVVSGVLKGRHRRASWVGSADFGTALIEVECI